MNTPDQFPDSHGGHMENGYSGFSSDWCDAILYALGTWMGQSKGYPNAYHEQMETRREGLYVPRLTADRLGAATVTSRTRTVPNGPVIDLGGSKVGGRLVPTRSRWSDGRNQSLTEALERVWERTFGAKTHVDSRDLEFFPHLTRSHPFPLVPGTGAGTWNVAHVTRSRPYRGNGSWATSGGQGMHVRQTKITGTGQSAVVRRRDV